MYRQKNIRPSRLTSKKLLLCLSAFIVIAAGILIALEANGKTHLFRKPAPHPTNTASQNTKGETVSKSAAESKPNTSTVNSSDASAVQPGDTKSTSGGGTTNNLIVPNGTFVSAHKVPLSADLSSVCNTSAGASCTILFRSGSTTKSLPAQTADRGGSAYWNSWTPASIGLTPGMWKIEATATLDSQIKTATDATTLEVSQ